MGNVCYCCGVELGPDNLAWNYELPQVFAGATADELADAFDFRSDAFLVTRRYGVAIRVILPIRLDNDRTATLGVWMSLEGEDANRVNAAARDGGEAWIGCTFTGQLLNEVRPWPETCYARITALASEDRTLARVVDSEDPVVKRMLTETWPHREFLRERPS
ncbi:hypothetical protein GCM10029964_013630 [Kibdelosporangium lantanae]